MLCSTIIPTIGRSSVARAIQSVLAQDLPNDEFEVLVINDSGAPLPEADWQQSHWVQIIDTNKRERSVARNAGAAAARGKYLHFLDDDDCLVPGAYRHLKDLSRSSSAAWLYGMTQLADRRDRATIQLRHNLHGNCFLQAMAGEWIPLQSSWIARETFLKVGGFNPLLAGPEDIDLLRRILLQHELAETPNLIGRVIMGGEGSSTDYSTHPHMSRWARESILDQPGAYARMLPSARNPMWRGRMARIYLTSAIWNIQQRRLFTTLSRLTLSMACMLQSNVSMLTRDFWKSVRTPYASVTFENGRREAGKEPLLES